MSCQNGCYHSSNLFDLFLGVLNEKETEMDFGQALYCLKDGKKVRRESWDKTGLHIFMRSGEFILFDGAKHVRDLIWMFCGDKNSMPREWKPRISELLAEDWQVVE